MLQAFEGHATGGSHESGWFEARKLQLVEDQKDRVFRHSVRLGYLSYDHERIVSGCEPIVIISAQFVGLSQLHNGFYTWRTEADMKPTSPGEWCRLRNESREGRFLSRYSWWIVSFQVPGVVFFLEGTPRHMKLGQCGNLKFQQGAQFFCTTHIWHKWMWLCFFLWWSAKNKGVSWKTASPKSFSCIYVHFTWTKKKLTGGLGHPFFWLLRKTKQQKHVFLQTSPKRNTEHMVPPACFFASNQDGRPRRCTEPPCQVEVAWQINSMVVWRLLDVWRSWPTPSPRSRGLDKRFSLGAWGVRLGSVDSWCNKGVGESRLSATASTRFGSWNLLSLKPVLKTQQTWL